MNISLSAKLFLKLNQTVGKSRWLDFLYNLCAQWLVWAMFAFFLLYIIFFAHYSKEDTYFVLMFYAAVMVFSLVVSYAIALVWKHERPIKEFPGVKVLFNTLGTWKSFPSDHTIFAFSMPLTLVAHGDQGRVVAVYFFMATLVGLGRICAGVHYPRDVIGGILVALDVVCFLSYALLFI